ncbi:MAG: DUF58 domain-containing protein [Gammaproteobacteria bacterium]|nr:DUF58 domain-containing protein [Gammaproteobacteria bacterium]
MDRSATAAIAPAEPALVSTPSPRVRLRPTAAGAFHLVITLTITLGGINYNSALACGLGSLLGALALVSAVHAWRNLHGVALRGAWAEPVFAGEPLCFHLAFPSVGPARHALSLDLAPQRGWHRGCTLTDASTFDLPHQGGTATFTLPTTTRGRKRCPCLRLGSIHPLGLFQASVAIAPEAIGLVYPAPDGSWPLPLPQGQESAALRGGGPGTDDFAGLRDYHPGDPPRAIAWRTLAHGDRLAVKRFVAGAADSLTLRWDHVARLPAIEQGLSQLCRWLLQAERLNLAVGLDLPGIRIAPGRGVPHLAACLRALAEFDA